MPFIYTQERGRLAGWLRDGLARFAVKGVDPKKRKRGCVKVSKSGHGSGDTGSLGVEARARQLRTV